MLRNLRARRRPRYGPHVCALIAALLLLLSVSLLHSRLGSDRDSLPHSRLHSSNEIVSDPLLDDTDPDLSYSTTKVSEDRIDEIDDVQDDFSDKSRASDEEEILGAIDSEDEEVDQSRVSGYYFDHVKGVIRRAFDKRSIDEWEDYESFDANLGSEDRSKVAIGSDDVPVDENVRRKVVEVEGIEDALLLKTGSRVSPLREGWGPWFDAKSDFLRRDRMFKSNLEILNPLNNPLLQDPDGVGVTGLTRGDKLVQKGLLNEFKKVPFLFKKPLAIKEGSTHDLKLKSEGVANGGEDMIKKSISGSVEEERGGMKRVERRTLDDNASNLSYLGIGDSSEILSKTTTVNLSLSNRSEGIQQKTVESIDKVVDSSTSNSVQSGGFKNVQANTRIKSEVSGEVYANGKRWGYFPGLHPRLSFSNFMDAFFRKGKCSMRVFMVWNSPPWMISVRLQRGLESLLSYHQGACVVVFSETIELNFFEGFVKDGFKVAVAMPNLDELLKDTPTHVFASVWFEWRKTNFYSTHYSELVRLAALYKYGGLYLDSDIIVLRPLSSLNNTVGLEDELDGSSLNGAVMSFRKHSPFIMECLTEFYSTYDDTRLRWNGADLLTRVARNFLRNKNTSDDRMELKLQPSFNFFPISRNNITRYFAAPTTETGRTQVSLSLSLSLSLYIRRYCVSLCLSFQHSSMGATKDSDPSLGYLTRKETEVKLPRPTRVKNKTPAPIQITAEQILREARERQEAEIRPPKQKITDVTELNDYRLRKRKEFEDLIRRVRWNTSVWIKYAQWEESQKDFNRARSVWERALEVDYRNHTLWLKYAEVEMKNKFINHARNVWDRAVTLLPRVDQLWYKYIHMEEILGNVAGARQIFERWMTWQPDQQGWLSYIKFELRYNEIERARAIFERFVLCHPKVTAWIRFAKFEMKNGEIGRARNCYERAVDKLADDEEAEQLFVAFAEFEERCKEPERARCIYKFALDHIPKGRAEDLYRKFVAFEKQYGDKEGIEDAIVGKRRFQYEDEVKKNPLNYDSWFDYIRLEESVGNKNRVREVYERAIANVPPAEEKRYWQRYIYLWINYALYEELDAQDMERTREVYRECLKLIPHEKFSFAKIWLLAAQFEIRQLNLKGARLILGNAIGKAPKDKIFKKYIEIELQLGNIDRCRKLYEKYLEWAPENCYAWSKYAELERSLSETERARSIFELAIAQPALDMPELLWKAYIDFEMSENEFQRTRELYERLLDRTKHLKVWISFAKFEASAMEDDERGSDLPEDDVQESLLDQKKLCLQRARRVFERAVNYFRTSAPELKEERAMLLDEWLNMESSFDELGDVSLVRVKLPKKLKRRRQIETEDGPAGYEEYIDYLFPEETQTTNLKILEAAYKWKKQKVGSDED